jgi:hypothetical protein
LQENYIVEDETRFECAEHVYSSLNHHHTRAGEDGLFFQEFPFIEYCHYNFKVMVIPSEYMSFDEKILVDLLAPTALHGWSS